MDVYSEWPGEPDRVLRNLRIVAYPTARGCAAAYYPETNPLVPLDSTAEGSNTPTSKSVIISLVPTGTPAARTSAAGSASGSSAMDPTGDDDGHKSRPEPTHLS